MNVLEDIGAADLYIAGIVMALANKKVIRKQIGEKAVLFWIIEQMVTALKDRTTCDLLVYAGYSPQGSAEKQHIASLGPDAYTAIYFDQSRPFGQRTVAGWCLAGTRRYNTEQLPEVDLGQNFLPLSFKDMGFPPLLTYVIEAGSRRSREGLFIPLALAWEAMIKSPWVKAETFPELSGAKDLIAGLPPASFDTHTQDGKRAFAYFAKACDPVREFFDARPYLNKVKTLGIAVFIFEGALLNPRLLYDGHDVLYRAVMDVELQDVGLIKEDVAVLKDLLASNWDALNHARRRVTA